MRAFFTLLTIVFAFASFSQSQETMPGDSIPWEIRKQSFIYNSALMFNDPLVARVSLYNLLAENPANVPLYDSLAYSYYAYGQYASAALVSQQALQIAPDDRFALDVAANSFDRLGASDKAVTYFEKIFLVEDNPMILYKISFLQLNLERFAEAEESTDEIIADPRSEEVLVSFPKVDDQNETQEVSLKIAAHRVKAMIEEAKGNVEGAQAKYIEVLTMYPGFQIVQQQLRELTTADGE